MRIKNDELSLSSQDLTLDTISQPLWLAHIVNYSVQANLTGTPNGTLKLQGSNDFGGKDAQNPNIANWSDLGIEQVVTSAGSYILQDKDCGYRWVRLVWINTSSAGGSEMESARFNVKGV